VSFDTKQEQSKGKGREGEGVRSCLIWSVGERANDHLSCARQSFLQMLLQEEVEVGFVS